MEAWLATTAGGDGSAAGGADDVSRLWDRVCMLREQSKQISDLSAPCCRLRRGEETEIEKTLTNAIKQGRPPGAAAPPLLMKWKRTGRVSIAGSDTMKILPNDYEWPPEVLQLWKVSHRDIFDDIEASESFLHVWASLQKPVPAVAEILVREFGIDVNTPDLVRPAGRLLRMR